MREIGPLSWLLLVAVTCATVFAISAKTGATSFAPLNLHEVRASAGFPLADVELDRK